MARSPRPRSDLTHPALQPEFGLMQGEGANPVFAESDVVAALKKAAADGVKLQNIRSVGGL